MRTLLRLSVFPLSIFMMAILYDSRSFMFGAFCAWALLLMVIFRPAAKVRIVIAIIAVITLIVLFWLKLDSSLGRLLIYKVSLPLLQENWLTGIGYGNLSKVYLYEQAAYFASQSYTEKELLLADNTFFVFNEYYRLLIELGIWVLIPMLFILISLFRLSVQAIKTHHLFAYLFTSVLIAILVASLFTNTFSKSFYWILWLTQSVVSLWLIKLKKKIACLYVNISILLLTAYVTVILWQAEQQLTDLKYEVRSGEYDTREITQRLEVYKPQWYSDQVSILEIRSEFYIQQENWEMARQSVDFLVEQKPLNVSFANLAMIYERLDKKELAEHYYLLAVHAVPNRFVTRLQLFDFYLHDGQYTKAQLVGEEIMNLPVKIPSPVVNDIRNTVQYKLNEL